jgi:hypothetical protein
MVDYNNFLLEVFGDSNKNNNEIYARLLFDSRLRIKHPITCDTPSIYYRRTKKLELINGDPEREITLVGTEEYGPSYFVSSNKDPKSGSVSRIWIDNLSFPNSRLYNLFWLPGTDYVVLAEGVLNSSNDIVRINIKLYDRETLMGNEIPRAEDIAVELSKRECVDVMRSDLVPSASEYLNTDTSIPYSSMLDVRGLTDKVLPKRKNKIAGFIANLLKD